MHALSPGLYAILDTDTLTRRGMTHAAMVTFAQRVLAAGRLSALQLRAKSLDARATLDLARAIGPWCRAAEVPLVVNDRADLAWLAGASMVHVGQDDLSPDEVARVAPSLGVGLSTHTLDELKGALSVSTDYVAMGPIFGTASKSDAAPTVGLEVLRVACERARVVGRPLVAIGGISLDNAAQIRAAGAHAGAVIGALVVDDARVTEVARALHQRLGGS